MSEKQRGVRLGYKVKVDHVKPSTAVPKSAKSKNTDGVRVRTRQPLGISQSIQIFKHVGTKFGKKQHISQQQSATMRQQACWQLLSNESFDSPTPSHCHRKQRKDNLVGDDDDHRTQDVRKPVVGAQWKLFKPITKATPKVNKRKQNKHNAARRSKEKLITFSSTGLSSTGSASGGSSGDAVKAKGNLRYCNLQNSEDGSVNDGSEKSSGGCASTQDSSQNQKKSAASLSENVVKKLRQRNSHKDLGAKMERLAAPRTCAAKNHSDDAVNCQTKAGEQRARKAAGALSTSSEGEYSWPAHQINSPVDSSQNLLRRKIASVEYNKVVTEESLNQMQETIREMNENINYLKRKLIYEERDVTGLDMDRMKSQIDDLYGRHGKVLQHLRGQDLQNAIITSNRNSIAPIKSDGILRLSQQMKLNPPGRMRASYPGWFHERRGYFYSSSNENINHEQYLRNIMRKVDGKQRDDTEEVRFEQWSENDTDGPSAQSIGQLVSDESDTINPFQTMRHFGSTSTFESYSPPPERDDMEEVAKPFELKDIVQSQEATRKGYTTKVTSVSLTSLAHMKQQEADDLVELCWTQPESTQIRSQSKCQLKQFLNLSRIVEENSSDQSMASPKMNLGMSKQMQDMQLVESDDEDDAATLHLAGSVANWTEPSDFRPLRSIES